MNAFARVLAAILTSVLLSVPAQARDDEEREGGIIGTGIVGTVADLGSIHVNGQRIRFDSEMPVSGSVTPMTASDLRPGHTVAVIVVHEDDGWQATHIRKVLPLVGQVTAIGGEELTILGTQVAIADVQADINIDDWVAVSGLWRGSQVLASWIDVLDGVGHLARLSGSYMGADQAGNMRVGGSNVSGLDPQSLQPGTLLRVAGEPEAGGITAVILETGLFDDPVGLVQVQGYFSQPQANGFYTILGSGLVAHTDQPEMIDPGRRVIQCGTMGRLGDVAPPDGTDADQNAFLWVELNC